jgi:hypothetical protein
MRKYMLFILGAVFILTAVTLGSFQWINNASHTESEVIAAAVDNGKRQGEAVKYNYTVETLNTAGILTPQAHEQEQPQKKPLTFDTINGISLFDSRDKVLAELGEPLEKIEHEFNQDMVNYDYGHMQILFIGDSIQNIAIPASEEDVQLDTQTLPMDQNQIAAILGEPHLKAEDGILYLADGVYIKIFFKPNSMSMDSVHFFTQGI